MIDFQYHSPFSVEEALELLDRYGDDARIMAGGTALVLQMKQRLSQPGHIIGLRQVSGLCAIETAASGDGALELGSLCTHRQVEMAPAIKEKHPLVADAFGKASTPRIRSMATVGGGLAHGDPNQDPPPALIALGASAVLISTGGSRTVPLEDLFIDYYETEIRPGEILTRVQVPPPLPGSGAVYLKFLPRTADDYATVSVAVVITLGQDEICRDIRIVLGSSGVIPVHATDAETVLRGQPLNEANIQACAEAVRDAVDPLDDFRCSAPYKRDMAEVFTRRAIQQAAAASRRG